MANFPDVPPKGATVTLPEMQRLCESKGLPRLWQRIAADPPPKPFVSFVSNPPGPPDVISTDWVAYPVPNERTRSLRPSPLTSTTRICAVEENAEMYGACCNGTPYCGVSATRCRPVK